jgi:hypothetical protein
MIDATNISSVTLFKQVSVVCVVQYLKMHTVQVSISSMCGTKI